jgi:uncharacterized membrane protein
MHSRYRVTRMIDLLIGTALLPLVLIAPGLAWTFLILPSNRIPWPERLGWSIGLSLIVAPFAVFWANFALGVPVTRWGIALVLVAVTLLPVAWSVTKGTTNRGRETADEVTRIPR